MSAPTDPAQQNEFGVTAAWTADAISHLDHTSVVSGACQGSASPAALAWLAECLQLHAGQPLIDVGAGLGGPAAWAAEHYGVSPTVVEPMVEASDGSRRLFDHRATVASAAHLPFRDGSFPVGWTLGVLDTVPDPSAALREMRRVLGAEGRFGVLAYVAREDISADECPDGNVFQTTDELISDLVDAGFCVIDRVEGGSLPPAPLDWQLRQDRIQEVVDEAHGHDPRLAQARRQSDLFGSLLRNGRVASLLLHLVCV